MRQTLKAIPLFKDLDNKDLDLIAALLRRISYAKDQIIFRQGDIGNAMYLVESGQLIVWDEDAQEALAYLGPGSFAGEIALLLTEPRSATLKVALDANLYVLDKWAFDQLIERRPAIAVYMTRELSQRLVTTSKQRFKPQAKRISTLWGVDNGELVRTLDEYVEKSIAVIPLPGTFPHNSLINSSGVFVLNDPDLSIENLAGRLGIQVEIYSHIILLLPQTPSPLGRKALSLSDVTICVGPPPPWVKANVSAKQIWETTDSPADLQRIARRLTGHTVGLALSSGGGKGLAHIGVMKVLQDENIPVDLVAGTSAGAFFGGIYYASGWNDERHANFAKELQSLNRWFNWDINLPPRAGILKGAKAKELIARLVAHKQFEDLSIPFYCIAADIMTGEEVIFDSGELAEAIRASLSIPMLADPWQIDNRYLIDGAFVDPIPAKLLREKGADIVIASSVIQPLSRNNNDGRNGKAPPMPHFLKIITNLQNIVEDQLVKNQLDDISVMIHTSVSIDHALDFSKSSSIIAAGETAARAQLPAIKACLDSVRQS